MATQTEAGRIAEEVGRLNREEVICAIKSFRGSATLDFTEEFLQARTLNQLRHILMAARLHLAH